MGETTDNRPNNQEGQSFTAREFELIQELVRSSMIWKEICNFHNGFKYSYFKNRECYKMQENTLSLLTMVDVLF